jgi:hypothetical protein
LQLSWTRQRLIGLRSSRTISCAARGLEVLREVGEHPDVRGLDWIRQGGQRLFGSGCTVRAYGFGKRLSWCRVVCGFVIGDRREELHVMMH